MISVARRWVLATSINGRRYIGRVVESGGTNLPLTVALEPSVELLLVPTAPGRMGEVPARQKGVAGPLYVRASEIQVLEETHARAQLLNAGVAWEDNEETDGGRKDN